MNRIATRTQKSLLPLVALGGSLAGLPAQALELGELTVQSRLGQPLRASIAYALAPHEAVNSTCVTLGLGATSSGLPGIGRATVSIADGTILLTGKTPIREPMVAAQINVNCAYTANLSREYMLFIDPAGPAFDKPATVETPAATAAPVARQSRPVTARRAPTARKAPETPIGKATRYRVQPGDTLSGIVARIEDRPVGLWAAVDKVFQANPDAFVGNDIDKLKAGSWLSIPSFDGSEPVVSAAVVRTELQPTLETANPPATESAADANASLEVESVAVSFGDTVNTIDDIRSEIDATGDLSPAATIQDSDNPFVDGAETVSESVVIPDTEMDGPETVSSSPNVVTATISNDAPESSSSWLLWLAGSGLAIIIGLLLFGRVFRGRPVEPLTSPAVDHPSRRATDNDSDGSATTQTHTILDDDPTAENLALDADLVMGTGLDAGTDVGMEVAEDFGFAETTELDIELPFEPEPTVSASDTGIFAAADDDETAVLEIDADGEDDEYDVSVILDATKMPRPEDGTQQDLQAVDVSTSIDRAQTGSYTISSEADLEILEQDYEHELTATQALNAELARAADDLAATREALKAIDDPDATSVLTAASAGVSVDEIDRTSEMPASETDEYEIETGIHEAATIEMPAAENDETVEIELEGDTKAV